MPSTMDKYKQGFQLGQSISGQRRQGSMEEERLGISRGHLNVAQQKLWNLMNEPPESPYGKIPGEVQLFDTEEKQAYVDKLTRSTTPQLSQMQQWLADNPGKTVEDYKRMVGGIEAEFRQPQKPPAKEQEAQRKVEWQQLNKIVKDAKTKGIKYRPFSQKQDERWRVLNAEFGGKEIKPQITLKTVLAELGKTTQTGQKIYKKPSEMDRQIQTWTRFDPVLQDSVYESVNMPKLSERPIVKVIIDAEPTKEAARKKLVEIGYDEKTIDWLMETLSKWKE